LEALTQVVVDQTSVMLVAYDSGYPEPLHSVRPIPEAFGVAMVLAPVSGPPTPAAAIISAALTDAPAESMPDARLEVLRAEIPAARGLPLLAKLARRESGRVVIDYLEAQRIAIEVSACG
jgi:hypothetical protein